MVAREVPLVMPKMSMTMTEGVFLTWHKSPGDEVREGEVVCEVATDKVDMEVEATVAGTLTRLLASPEDVVPVGEPIAYVAAESDELLEGLFDAPDPPADQTPPPAPPPETRAESAAAGHRQVAGGEAEPSVAPPVHGRAESGSPAASATLPGSASQPDSAAAGPRVVAAVPAARRLATERGVDLATITPTGPWDTIRLSDVDTGRRAGNGRTAIARRMAASAQIPQFVLYRDLDLETVDRTHGWTVLLTHAFATALRRHPALNASWADGVTHHEHVGVALAVDTDRGLLAPVLTDPDLDTLDTLGTRLADVVGRARTGRLGLAELTAPATTTVSNLGGLGVTGFHAVLTPPQATALAVGAIEPKVVPVPGGVGVRLRCTVGLTVDHRVADGAEAARLLGTLQELL